MTEQWWEGGTQFKPKRRRLRQRKKVIDTSEDPDNVAITEDIKRPENRNFVDFDNSVPKNCSTCIHSKNNVTSFGIMFYYYCPVYRVEVRETNTCEKWSA